MHDLTTPNPEEIKAKLEDARNMLELKMPLEIIAKVTGLDLATIKSINS